jgi:predicted Rossmann fold flavoprotein
MPDIRSPQFDVVVIGAGAAGLFCAGQAGQRGLKVLLVDHSEKVAEKIRISGGGRCNFTNRDLEPAAPHKHFLGDNPNFCRSALSRYTPQDFIELVQKHGIAFHEKHKGQLFGDHSSDDFIRMLVAECDAGAVVRWQPCSVKSVRSGDDAGGARYEIETDRGPVRARNVVIATGGLSIPKIGATDFGYRIAKQFGLRLVEPRPALAPLTFDGEAWAPYSQLSGLALPVRISTVRPEPVEGPAPKKASTLRQAQDRPSSARTVSFDEDLLFTHRGLSGPAVLQISSFWREGQPIRIDLAPNVDLKEALLQAKARSRKLVANELATLVPSRLADAWVQQDAAWQRPINEATDKALIALAERLSRWELVPTGTEGYRKAEVTAGGVDTRELSSQTMESRHPGLFFIGEVVDVTGWLGGYNFQWAWASAHACAKALSPPPAAAITPV